MTEESRQLQVTISYDDGSSPLDVSAIVAEFTPKNSHLDEHPGLIKTTGILRLWAYAQTPLSESTNPVRNPARWARGNQIILQFADSTGSLVAHPRGRLRILKAPPRPYAGRTTLDIEVGCLLSLQDWRQPPGDKSGIELGTSTNRSTLINRLAAAAGLPNLVETITDWPIDYPLPRLNGSWVEQMGVIAHEAGYVLWIDSSEQLRAQKVDLYSGTPEFVLTVGDDESIYAPLESQETPCEVIRVTGVKPNVSDTEDPAPEVAIASDDEYNPSEISTTTIVGSATTTPLTIRVSRQPLGRVMPDNYPNSPSLITATEEQSTSYYNDADTGELLQQFTMTRQPLGVVLPDTHPGEQGLTIATRTYKDYYYDSEITTTTQITTRTYAPAQVVYPDKNISGQTLSSLTIERWQKVNSGWQKVTTVRAFGSNGSSSTSTTFSNSGNNQPPAVERRQEEKYGEDVQIVGVANLAALAGSAYYQRDREYQAETLVSQDHANWLAKHYGALLWSRLQMVNWGMEISDVWLTNYKPLMVMDWTETDPSDDTQFRNRYLTDGVAFSHVKNRCAVAGDSLNLGSVPIAGGITITPPYSEAIALSGEFVLDGDLLLYEPIPTTSVNFEWIVVSADGSVLTSDGNVVSSQGDFSEIVVGADGNILTSNGNVVTTGSSGNWDAIAVGSDGTVLTSNGEVVTSG